MPSPIETIRRTILQQLESAELAGIQQLSKKSRCHNELPPASQRTSHSCASPEHLEGSETSTVLQFGSSMASGNQSRSSILKSSGYLFDDSSPRSVAEEISTAPTLDALKLEVAACTACKELARTRTHVVVGAGNPSAQLCFLGEAPGADEDRQGEPFVGRAGKLLTDILQNGMKLKRKDVYILNILKCRPPGNRNPLPDEVANCRPFLLRQLELIRPDFICCLGAIAAQNLLDTTESIGSLRGRLHHWGKTLVICTYHPAYLLRNPSAKAKTWDDIQLLMRAMGLMT